MQPDIIGAADAFQALIDRSRRSGGGPPAWLVSATEDAGIEK
jgi:hypothetical protein